MRQWCYIDNFSNFDSGSVYGSNSRLTSVTWTLNVCFNLSQSEVKCYLCTILCSHLCCVWSVLL